MIKIKIFSLLALVFLFSSGCGKFDGAVTWTAHENGTFSSKVNTMGKETLVEMKIEDYFLTVNGRGYGLINSGDRIKVKDGKVSINDTEVFPLPESD